MSNFTTLYNTAFAITEDIKLSPYASIGGVSCAIITQNWNIFTGKCLGFSCWIWFCAEHSAIAEMLKSDHSWISEIIAVRDNGEVVPPCGRCREMMMQISPEHQKTIVYIGKETSMTLDELLPYYWN